MPRASPMSDGDIDVVDGRRVRRMALSVSASRSCTPTAKARAMIRSGQFSLMQSRDARSSALRKIGCRLCDNPRRSLHLITSGFLEVTSVRNSACPLLCSSSAVRKASSIGGNSTLTIARPPITAAAIRRLNASNRGSPGSMANKTRSSGIEARSPRFSARALVAPRAFEQDQASLGRCLPELCLLCREGPCIVL